MTSAGPWSASTRPSGLTGEESHIPSLHSHGYRGVVAAPAELETAIAAVYAKQLPIPAWWPAEARAVFIEEYASEAAIMVLSEFDAIGDRVTDWAARSQISGADTSAMVASARRVLLDEACSEVQYDLSDLIASKSAELRAEAVFGPGRPRGPQHVVWPIQHRV